MQQVGNQNRTSKGKGKERSTSPGPAPHSDSDGQDDDGQEGIDELCTAASICGQIAVEWGMDRETVRTNFMQMLEEAKTLDLDVVTCVINGLEVPPATKETIMRVFKASTKEMKRQRRTGAGISGAADSSAVPLVITTSTAASNLEGEPADPRRTGAEISGTGDSSAVPLVSTSTSASNSEGESADPRQVSKGSRNVLISSSHCRLSCFNVALALRLAERFNI